MTDNQSATGDSLFKQKHSLLIRIWHWTFFLGILASLVTVLLGSTMFRTRENIGLVQEQVQQKGGSVTKDQAWAVAHEYSDKLWDTHKIIGFVLSFLLLSRVLIEFGQSKEEKMSTKIRRALGLNPENTDQQKDRKHYLRVNRSYQLFYLLILIMALTGLGLAFEDVPFLRSIHKPLGNIHSFVQYFIYAFILVHLVGVVRADLGKSKGIVSSMINGG